LGKRRYRKKVESLKARIQEHQEKIRRERQRDEPDEGMIAHWEREIRAFQEGIRRAMRRLGGEG